jgi:hypothetical protein
MKKTSLKHLVKSGLIKNISKLRTNINGYPYVTVLGGNGRSQNIYFGRKTAELVMDNFSLNDSIIAFLADADIIQTQNEEQKAAGEWRFKISKNAASDYASEMAFAEAFGLELGDGEFNVKLFTSSFSTKEDAITSNAPKASVVLG